MLGKTAGGLFWMYRYLERAENTARLIETGQRIALTRAQASDDEWRSVLETAAALDGFMAKNGQVTKDDAIDWLLRDMDNPSSIRSVIRSARLNARLVRTALTYEVWETVNGTYMQMEETLARRVSERDLPAVLSSVRERTALVRGATLGTMLRNDIYDFARLGTFTERADNTCRILDVKYYVLLPSAFSVGSSLDNVQWETILRSVSGGGGYRLMYGQDARPKQIVQFLVLDKRMPRSIAFCADKLRTNLDYLVKDYGIALPGRDMAAELSETIDGKSVDAIFEHGLHEFIQDVLSSLGRISRQIEIDYRFYE